MYGDGEPSFHRIKSTQFPVLKTLAVENFNLCRIYGAFRNSTFEGVKELSLTGSDWFALHNWTTVFPSVKRFTAIPNDHPPEQEGMDVDNRVFLLRGMKNMERLTLDLCAENGPNVNSVLFENVPSLLDMKGNLGAAFYFNT